MNGKEGAKDPLEQCKRELDEILPGVTAEAVDKAMQGFPLPLADGWNSPRLATVVRRVLAWPPQPERLPKGSHRNSPYFIERESLKAMASKAAGTAVALKSIEMSTRGRIMSVGLLSGSSGNQNANTAPAMQRFDNIVKELEWLAGFLEDIASGIQKPPPKWAATADREWRIHLGWGLAAVYEAAFARRPTAHKSESGETPFMKFFQRMMALAFKLGGGGPDLKAITFAACKRHRDEPARCDWLMNP